MVSKVESVFFVVGSSDVGCLVVNSVVSVGIGFFFKYRGSFYFGWDWCSRYGDYWENGNEGGEELKWLVLIGRMLGV